MVNLFPREVTRVINLFARELIEGTSDPRPKTRGAAGPEGFWPRVWPKMQQRVRLTKILRGSFNQLPWEQIENSMDFLRKVLRGAFNQLPREKIENSMSSLGFSLANQF